MRRPSTADLPVPLARAAQGVARALAERGRRVWIVGGAVRDLALERSPKDVDLATDAPPEDVEAAFEKTAAVGRAFGTVLVMDFGFEVQVTTFRSERGYSDARRPDDVVFGATAEEDARRRDFTCNALFLDPLTDELLDPTGGLADLEAGRLRCVGDARERFREDGLRLLRLARFAGSLGLRVEPETLAAARAAADSLRGVSGERVYAELARMASGPDPERAFGLLDDLGLLERLLPGWDSSARRPVLARLPGDAPATAWLAALTEAGEAMAALPAPRAVAEEVGRIVAAVESWDLSEAAPSRAEAIRAVREPWWPAAAVLARARGGAAAARAEAVARAVAGVPAHELRPEPLLSGKDLTRAGLRPGPEFGALLEELETLQLEGEVTTREAALTWLAGRTS